MSGRKVKQCKKLLDQIRYRLIDLHALVQPEAAKAGKRRRTEDDFARDMRAKKAKQGGLK